MPGVKKNKIQKFLKYYHSFTTILNCHDPTNIEIFN